jgi:hypothetical protein
VKLAHGWWGLSIFLLVLIHAPAHAATDITWVQNQLDTQQFTSIESFLAALPQDYRSRYTLMYDSGSLQEATVAEPRVIAYGTDASLVLAYNSGDPALHGSDTVELIQFNQPETRFEFYEISKSKTTGKLQLTSETAKCEGCHRTDDPRPNWQPYDNWPGAYGSKDDYPTSDEKTGLVNFLKTAASNPRYETLLNLPSTSADNEVQFTGAPNTALVDTISQWNYMRAARLVRATKDYDSYKYAILGSSDCSSEFDRFFPKSNPLPSNWQNVLSSSDTWVVAFVYLFESRGINWRDWSMMITGVESDIFDNNPFIAGYTYGEDLVANIVKQDAELQAYAQVTESTFYEGVEERSVSVTNCDALAKLSQKALSK